ncbi:MAG: hypothetical protein LLF94_10940 [Chlamydiales bacterium]|nr:hypothetical protein [Chlamydiales bacterium]
MADEIDILKQVCLKLEQVGLPYMLTGSFAANFYAVPRMTRDIDIVIEIFKPDVAKLIQTFEEDFYIDNEAIAEAIKHQGMFNIIHNESVFKIDFIIRKDSLYRNTEFQRKCRVQLDNVEIWIVSPEDLILSKLEWAKDSLSEMQLNDVKNLLHSIKNLDKNYLDSWIERLNLGSIYKKVEIDA